MRCNRSTGTTDPRGRRGDPLSLPVTLVLDATWMDTRSVGWLRPLSQRRPWSVRMFIPAMSAGRDRPPLLACFRVSSSAPCRRPSLPLVHGLGQAPWLSNLVARDMAGRKIRAPAVRTNLPVCFREQHVVAKSARPTAVQAIGRQQAQSPKETPGPQPFRVTEDSGPAFPLREAGRDRQADACDPDQPRPGIRPGASGIRSPLASTRSCVKRPDSIRRAPGKLEPLEDWNQHASDDTPRHLGHLRLWRTGRHSHWRPLRDCR